MSHFHTAYAFTANEIFDSLDMKRVHFTKATAREHGCMGKKGLCAAIFLSFMRMVLLDIIQKNATFVFKSKSRQCYLNVSERRGPALLRAVKRGAFQGIDFFATNGIGYLVTWTIESATRKVKEIRVYIDKTNKKILYDNVNNGKVYY